MSFENLIHASDNIVASLLYLFICFITIIWLVVVYFNKKRKNTIRSVFFKIILFTIILLLSSDVLIILFIHNRVEGLIYRIIYTIHWECFIWWFGTYRVYNILFLSGYGEEDWSSKNGLKRLYTEFPISKKILRNDIFKYLVMIIYLFLPFEMIDVNNVTLINGVASYYVVSYMFFIGCISSYETLVEYKNEKLFNKLSVVFVYLVMLVAIIFQYIISDTTVYCVCAAIQVYFLYFMVENPDIRLRKEIEMLKTDIEKSNKAKTDFLSNMSHEIRTPMNAIIGFSDSLLTNNNFDEKTARTDIENIYTAGNNLVDIINNILDISKIESEQNTINNKNCNIDKVVKELASVIKSRLGKKPIEFITELDEHIPSVVWADTTKLYQILLNIANNSVKYTEVGKIKLSCIAEEIDKKTVLLHFKIADTGYGIKEEDYDKVFKKYSRLDEATNKDIEGTGLGLVITKQFVELMNGKIWFSSDFEVGTTFYIDIPFKVVDSTPTGIQTEITTEKTDDGYMRHLDCSNYTVLIVDDNETNLKVAARLLEKYKFKIDFAKNGKDCIYKFKYGNHYDMILLDDMMPEMNGLETVKIIKKLDAFDIPPVVAFTANAMSGMGEKYIEAGFDYYLPMPVSIQELDELVNTYFGDKVKTYVEDDKGSLPTETGKEKIETEEILTEDNTQDNNETINNNYKEIEIAPVAPISIDLENINNKPLENNDIEEINNQEIADNKPIENNDTKEINNQKIADNKPIEENDTEEINNQETNEEVLSEEEYLRKKGVDMDKSLEFLMDMEMYNMTLLDFLSAVDEKWNKIKEYKQNGDMKNYSIEVHSLKSDCKYLGLMKLADISYEHELKSKENDQEFINQNFHILEEEFNNTMQLVKEYKEKYNIKSE